MNEIFALFGFLWYSVSIKPIDYKTNLFISMPDISTRINALIAYLFLGPIMLLAKNGTPLADPYVRWHAKRASLIIVIGALVFVFYRSLHSYLSFGIFGISIDIIIATSIVSITLLALIVGAYQAYHGLSASETSWRSVTLPASSLTEWIYSDEDLIRIISSFIPFVGIIIASQYPRRETIIGRKVGSLFAIVILTSIVFLSGSTTTLTLISTLSYIGLIVATAVQLFAFSRFLEFSLYSYIPTYTELDAHIKSAILAGIDFCRIAFGGVVGSTYQEKYQKILSNNQISKQPNISYFAPTWIVWIPGINLITLTSLWQSKYREYAPLILQWLALTIITIVIIWVYGISSQMGLYLLFPIITLIVGSRENLNTRSPITSIAVDIYSLFTRGQAKVAEIKKNGEEKVGYSYEVK